MMYVFLGFKVCTSQTHMQRESVNRSINVQIHIRIYLIVIAADDDAVWFLSCERTARGFGVAHVSAVNCAHSPLTTLGTYDRLLRARFVSSMEGSKTTHKRRAASACCAREHIDLINMSLEPPRRNSWLLVLRV